MTRSQHTAAAAVAALLVAAIAIIAIDRPAFSDDWVYRLPESAGAYVSDNITFCQNDQCLATVLASQHGKVSKCPHCGGELRGLSLAERRKLPADVQVEKRRYRSAGLSYDVSTVLSGYSRAGIHRPEVCLVAQGYRVVARNIEEVTSPSGDVFDVARLRAVHDSGHAVHYAYWFRCGTFETARHGTRIRRMGWDGMIRNRRHAWVYIAVAAQAGGAASASEVDSLHAFLGRLHDGIEMVPGSAPPLNPAEPVNRLPSQTQQP